MKKSFFVSRRAATLLLAGTLALSGCAFHQTAMRTPSVGEITADLIAYQAELMRVHPLLQEGALKDEVIADFADLRNSLTPEMDTYDVAWEVKKIIAKLGDEHTHINVNIDQEVIPVRFQNTSDGLVAADSYGNIHKGNIIKTIGQKSVDDVIVSLREIAPNNHENTLLGGILPHHLHTEMYLDQLGLIGDNRDVEIAFINDDGDLETMTLELTNYQWKLPAQFEYKFDKDTSTGVFVIRNYMELAKFEKNWAAFIEECRILQPDNILIDVRESTGGYSEYHFTDAIFSSLGIKEFRTPYPEYYKDVFKKPEIVNVNKHIDPISIENLYVATSNYTVSAPTLFAATIQENNLGTVVGQPVSNNRSFYASGAYGFQHMDLSAGISGYYLDYDGQAENEDLPLSPNVIIPLSADDVRLNQDPVLRWLKSISLADNESSEATL